MRAARTALVASILSIVGLTIGCAGGGSRPAPSTAQPTPSAGASPAATATATAPRATGVASIDAAVAAVVAGDAAALRRLLRYTPTACVTTPQGLGAPPACRPGEAEGKVVDAFQIAQCEGVYVRPEDVQLDIPPSAQLYGAYRVAQQLWPRGTYAAIFGRPESAGNSTAWELVLTDDGVVGVHLGCGMTPAEMARIQHLSDSIFAPSPAPGGAGPPAATP